MVEKFYQDHREFPLLKKIAGILLAVMPSTSVIERQFNTISHILTRQRNRLGEEKVLRILQVRYYTEFEAEIQKIQ